MSISGNIKTFPLTDLLQWFSMSRNSGALAITARETIVRVFLKNGVLVTALTNDPSRRIGQFLISRGYISEDDLRRALNIQENQEEVRIGDVLCESGFLEKPLLAKALRERTCEIVYDLFMLEDGLFHFDNTTDVPPGVVELNLGLEQLVMEGIRRKDEWERIREVLPTLSTRLVRVGNAPIPPSNTKGDEDDDIDCSLMGTLLDALESESRTISELVFATRRSPYDVSAALYQLYRKNCVDIFQPPPQLEQACSEEELFQSLEDEISRLIETNSYQEGRDRILEARQKGIDPHRLDLLVEKLAEKERTYLQRILPPNSVPILLWDMARARAEGLNPKEGYLLSRLGEGMSVKTLGQVMPLGEMEILRLLQSLLQKGVIRVQK